jgi:site-specific recombinase XerD
MAEVKFYLEKRKNKETGKLITHNVPIQLFFSFYGQRLQYYTGYRVDTPMWDEDHMKVKRNYADAAEINKELGKLKSKVEDIFDRAMALDIEITPDYIRQQLKNKNKDATGKKTLVECYTEYINLATLTKSVSTIKSIRSGLNIFIDFNKHSGIKLDFNNITQEFYDSFLDYCFNTRNYKNNYTGKLIKDLKTFLNWATEKGYNAKLDYKKKSFKKFAENTEIIYLTYEELMKLYHFKTDIEQFKNVRDLFCFGCFTGMRFSDIASLKWENIHVNSIQYRIVKTNELNTIPLNQFSKEILKRNKNKSEYCFLVPSEQQTNETLKSLFSVIELNRIVQLTHFQGAKKISRSLPLSKVITFHISKKTFMTNFLAKGGSLLTAMAITGNKDFKTARRYYKVVDSLKADEMAKVFGK